MKRATRNFLEDLILILAILIIILVVYFIFFSNNKKLKDNDFESTVSEFGFSHERIDNIKNKIINLISDHKETNDEEITQINTNETKEDKYNIGERLQLHEKDFSFIDTKNLDENLTKQNSQTQNNTQSNPSNQLENIEFNKNKIEINDENIKKKDEIEPIIQNIKIEEKNTNIENKSKKVSKKIENIDKEEVKIINEEKNKTEENINKLVPLKINVSQLFQRLENNIYENVIKDFGELELENEVEINLRMTILKNGNHEELIFVSGNEELFNKIKSSIEKTFPIKIEDHLKQYFPRYYRMKLNFK